MNYRSAFAQDREDDKMDGTLVCPVLFFTQSPAIAATDFAQNRGRSKRIGNHPDTDHSETYNLAY